MNSNTGITDARRDFTVLSATARIEMMQRATLFADVTSGSVREYFLAYATTMRALLAK